jgi:hypothetical protein
LMSRPESRGEELITVKPRHLAFSIFVTVNWPFT